MENTKDKEYYGFIYVTTNHINNKKYIGQRKYDKYGKWKDYLGSGIVLNKAIEKYGKENFSKEIIEKCYSKNELNEKEIYWIEYYDAVKSNEFYNVASGGDGGNTIAGYSEEKLEEYKKWKSELHKNTSLKGENAPCSKLTEKEIKEIIIRLLNNDFNSDIAKDYNVSYSTIDDIRNHKTWCSLTNGIIFDSIKSRKRGHSKKTVIQYDLYGNFIAEYESAREAEKVTGIGYKLISQVCNGKKRMAHNYIFRFKEDPFDKYEINNTYLVKVDQYDFSGKFIKTYDSEKEVKLKTGIDINSVLNGNCKSAGGYYWCRHGEDFKIPEYKRKRRNVNLN